MRFQKKYPKAPKYKVYVPGIVKGLCKDKCEVCRRITYWYSPTGPFLCSEKCFNVWYGDVEVSNRYYDKTKKEVKRRWLRWLESSEAKSWGIAMKLLGYPPEVVAYITTTKPLQPNKKIMNEQLVGYDKERVMSPEDWVQQYKKRKYKTNTIFRWAWYFYREGRNSSFWFERTDYFKVCLCIILGSVQVEKRRVTRFYDNRVRPFWIAYKDYKKSCPAEKEFQEKVRLQMARLKAIKKAEKIAAKVKAERKLKKVFRKEKKLKRQERNAVRRFIRRKRRSK